MTEEREEEQEQEAVASIAQELPPTAQYPHLLMGEDFGEVLGFAGPFKGASGFLEVHLYYWVHTGGVLLAAQIIPPDSMPRLWRRHWTSHLEAGRSAHELACDAEDYLRQMTRGVPMREMEDLDYDDYVGHLMTRINGEFH